MSVYGDIQKHVTLAVLDEMKRLKVVGGLQSENLQRILATLDKAFLEAFTAGTSFATVKNATARKALARKAAAKKATAKKAVKNAPAKGVKKTRKAA